MEAQALICNEAQEFSLENVTLPDPGPGQIAVRALRTGVSIGTEFALIRNKISWGPYPLCTGYQGVGVVEEAGDDVSEYAAGDKVYYRDNRVMALADGTAVSCVTGTHCTHAVIDPADTHGVAPLPEGVDLDAASLYVMPAVGLNGVDMANPRMGETVVVYGAGLIGLGVVAACAHRGCVVAAVDIDEPRLELARAMGADHGFLAADAASGVRDLASDGADSVFESTGLPKCIVPAIDLCKQHGAFVWQGNYGAAPVSFPFMSAHGKRLRMFFPCDDGFAPCRRAVMKNMASGALAWEKVITHRLEAADAPELYDRINRGEAADVIGAVIRWSD